MRLIDADALIVSKHWETCTCPAQAINKATTIEAEPVVRCGKCRYASDDIGAIARRYGKRGAVKCCNPKSIANNRLCLSDDFCSYGKEKK